MKKIFLFTICFFLSFSIGIAQIGSKKLQEFAQDLSSINIKVRGQLILFGKYKNDLSSLTYESYIETLKKSELVSNKGIAETINLAEKKYFKSMSKTFIIAIYSKNFNAVICDDANTAFIDYIKVLSPSEKIPELKNLLNNIKPQPKSDSK